MPVTDYISGLPNERQELMSRIHAIILSTDKSVKAIVEPMMGKEMIVYKAAGTFKYGLSSIKSCMSLYAIALYCVPAIHSKYKGLLAKASFQKGCINFKNEEEIPLDIAEQLIADCSVIDFQAIREAAVKSKKEAAIKSKKEAAIKSKKEAAVKSKKS